MNSPHVQFMVGTDQTQCPEHLSDRVERDGNLPAGLLTETLLARVRVSGAGTVVPTNRSYYTDLREDCQPNLSF